MQTCPLLRSLTARRSATRKTAAYRSVSTRANVDTRRRVAHLSAMLLEWIGWRALHDLLNAIPDSNDDFGMF
jgi:hypothetical protein